MATEETVTMEVKTSGNIQAGDDVIVVKQNGEYYAIGVNGRGDEVKEAADKAVIDTVTEYATTASPTTKPIAGDWSADAPAFKDGEYVWMRQTVKYGSGKVVVGDPVVITGNTGAKGEGVPGTSSYVHIAYANSADGTTDFDVGDPTGRSYMGTCSDENVDDPTDPTKYAWSKVKGSDGVSPTVTTTQTSTGATITITDADGTKTATVTNGAKGDQGESVKSVRIEYALSQSDTVAPTTGWQNDVPAVDKGSYCWIRSVTDIEGTLQYGDPALYLALDDLSSKVDEAIATTQYVWHDTEGVHVSETPQEQGLTGANVLLDSNELAFRDKTDNLATFGSDGATIGKPNAGRVEITSRAIDMFRASTYRFWSGDLNFQTAKGTSVGWTYTPSSSSLTFTMPSGMTDKPYTVIPLREFAPGITTDGCEQVSFSFDATSTALSGYGYITPMIIKEDSPYDSQGNLVAPLYMPTMGDTVEFKTDEISNRTLNELNFAFVLTETPKTLPSTTTITFSQEHDPDIAIGSGIWYEYVTTWDVSYPRHHFGDKTELAYTDTLGLQPMFRLDPNDSTTSFYLKTREDADGISHAVISGDAGGVYIGASGGAAITATASSAYMALDDGSTGYLAVDKRSAEGDTGLVVQRNGVDRIRCIESARGRRGIWDSVKSHWMIFREADGEYTLIPNLYDSAVNGTAATVIVRYSTQVTVASSLKSGSSASKSWTYTYDGYRPIGIIGANFADSTYPGHVLHHEWLTDRGDGTCKIHSYVKNTTSSSANTVKVVYHILGFKTD